MTTRTFRPVAGGRGVLQHHPILPSLANNPSGTIGLAATVGERQWTGRETLMVRVDKWAQRLAHWIRLRPESVVSSFPRSSAAPGPYSASSAYSGLTPRVRRQRGACSTP